MNTMPMRILRCFIALELPMEAQSELSQATAVLKGAGADVKWLEPENVHLTLKFLGEIPQSKVLQIGLALSKLKERRAIASRLGPLGAFPVPHKPRVVWAGLDDGQGELKNLFETMEAEMAALGFEREERAFVPHLTLGRVRSGQNLDELARLIAATRPEPVAFTFRALTLMKSTLTPSGPLYEGLNTIYLVE